MDKSAETVRKVEEAESERLAGVMARAFEADPMCIHLLPDQGRRLPGLEHAFRMFLRRIYLSQQECYTVANISGGHSGCLPGSTPLLPGSS